ASASVHISIALLQRVGSEKKFHRSFMHIVRAFLRSSFNGRYKLRIEAQARARERHKRFVSRQVRSGRKHPGRSPRRLTAELSPIENSHAQTGFGQRERARNSNNAPADNRRVTRLHC